MTSATGPAVRPQRPLGVGIVGCGNISTIYMQNLPHFSGVRLVACADARPEAAAAQAARHGIAALGLDALLGRDDIDVVVNLTVPNAHFAVSHAALTAGKHVFSEKPLTADLGQARRLVDEAEARGLLLGCAPDTFLGAGGRLARSLVDEGAVGRILSGATFLMSHGMEHWHPDPEFFFKPGGGPILDMAPYYLNTLVNLVGPVRRVFATASIGFEERLVSAEGPRKGERIRVETPTSVMAILDFEAGAQVVLTMSWDVWRHGHPPIELYGTEGSLRVPDPNFYGGIVERTERDGDWRALETRALPLGAPTWRSPAWPAERPAQANYRGLGVAELAAAVAGGLAHRSSGRLALHVVEVMHAILESGVVGQPVAIASPIGRPAPLAEAEAAALWHGEARVDAAVAAAALG